MATPILSAVPESAVLNEHVYTVYPTAKTSGVSPGSDAYKRYDSGDKSERRYSQKLSRTNKNNGGSSESTVIMQITAAG